MDLVSLLLADTRIDVNEANKEGRTPFYIACHNHRMQIFDEKGTFLRTFGSEGQSEGQLSLPSAAVVDQQGHYVVADSSDNHIQIFYSDGHFARKFGSGGKGNGELKDICGVGLLSNGNIVVAEQGSNRLQIFDSLGESVRIVGADGQVKYPQHLFVDSDDNILVADYNNGRIQVFNQNSDHTKAIGIGQIEAPRGVCMDREGVSEYDKSRISIF